MLLELNFELLTRIILCKIKQNFNKPPKSLGKFNGDTNTNKPYLVLRRAIFEILTVKYQRQKTTFTLQTLLSPTIVAI